MSPKRDRGALCLLLHAHMPYVEGFGTWPFGEEWLWEAVATVYLPLLDMLGEEELTIALTPVLCDQLELLGTGNDGAERSERAASPDPRAAADRFRAFLREVRAPLHAEDAAGLERAGERTLGAEIRRAAGDYAAADRSFERRRGDLVAAFGGLASHGSVELWAGPATHPVLPLLATDAGRELQLATGLAAHERRFGAFGGGLWLPECAYEPGLERDLADFGARAFCVDQTAVHGLGALEQLEPVATGHGPVAVPLDWQTISLVWDPNGYPSDPAYRDHHHRTLHDLKPWANDGAPYDRGRAAETTAGHARDFVARTVARLDAYRRQRGRPGLICCALDAELLGHWWYEGPSWLRAVLDEAPRQGLELSTLPRALELVDPVRRELSASTWGTPKDLTTWDAPAVAELAFAARAAELRVVAAGRHARGAGEALGRAARELLALQSSDWAFMVTRDLAGDYPLDRVRAHRRELDGALAALQDSSAACPAPELRNLAPALDPTPLIAP